MSKYVREHERTKEFTKRLNVMLQDLDFWEGYYSQRARGFKDIITESLAPKLARHSEVAFSPRSAKPWVLRLDNGHELLRIETEAEVDQALTSENSRSSGQALGNALLDAAEKLPVKEHLMTRMSATILGSYGEIARAWIATGYANFRQSRQSSYYTAIGRDHHDLHNLNPISLHFCFGIVSASYQWNNDLYLNGSEFSLKGGQWPQSLIEAAPGKRVDEIFDVPFVGDAIITRAYNYTGSLQITCKDEVKSIAEWIAEGVL